MIERFSLAVTARAWVLDDIHRIMRERMAERVDLGFEPALPLREDRGVVARAVAAMANEIGGTIVFGIEKDWNSRAFAFTPVRGDLAAARDAVRRIARSDIDGPVDVNVTAIGEGRRRRGRGYLVVDVPASDRGYLVVDVPASDRAPHLVRGVAWGRSELGLRRLTRAELAERFARSRHFLADTGLGERLLRPARIVVDVQRVGVSRILILRNVGERAALSVGWHVVSGWIDPLDPPGEDLAVDRLPPSAAHPVRGVFPPGTMPARVEVGWRDESGPAAQTVVIVT